MSLWDPRAKGGPGWPPAAVPRVVREAEEIVRAALGPELVRACDQAEVAVEAAFRDWQCAYSELATAQQGGDPREIIDAQLLLERALRLAQDRSVARDRIRQALSESRFSLSCVPRGRATSGADQEARQGEPEFPAGSTRMSGRLSRWRAIGRWLDRRAD